MQERGRNSAASRGATTSHFAARIEMPVVLRSGVLADGPALVPADMASVPGVRVPRRFGTIGWVTATALCAISVYAVRDTMFAPLAQSEAPSSAWETRTHPGDTTPQFVASPGTRHIDLDDPAADAGATDIDTNTNTGTGTGTSTGTAHVDTQLGPPSATVAATGSGAHAVDGIVAAATGPTSVTGAGADGTPTTAADLATSSTSSTSTPDTLGGHGADSGGGKGGPGNSGSP